MSLAQMKDRMYMVSITSRLHKGILIHFISLGTYNVTSYPMGLQLDLLIGFNRSLINYFIL